MTKIILENNYMNYFLMQQFLNELCESNLLSAEIIDNKTSYLITGYGRQTLEYFIKLIPKGIKNRIDNTISSIRKNVRNETLITADFIPESENEYIASCSVHEDNFSLIDLKITVGTKVMPVLYAIIESTPKLYMQKLLKFSPESGKKTK